MFTCEAVRFFVTVECSCVTYMSGCIQKHINKHTCKDPQFQRCNPLSEHKTASASWVSSLTLIDQRFEIVYFFHAIGLWSPIIFSLQSFVCVEYHWYPSIIICSVWPCAYLRWSAAESFMLGTTRFQNCQNSWSETSSRCTGVFFGWRPSLILKSLKTFSKCLGWFWITSWYSVTKKWQRLGKVVHHLH